MAIWNGDAEIFGIACTLLPRARPGRIQLDAFPGQNGRVATHHGSDGGISIANVLLWHPFEADLVTVETRILNYVANGSSVVGTLLDNQGRSWIGVYLADAEPLEGISRDNNGFSRRWTLVFDHLV
jgi:hypothetical protein